MKKQKHHIVFDIFMVLLIVVFFVSLYTFILQRGYGQAALEDAVNRDIKCSDAIHRLVSDSFNEEDFSSMNDISDMETERYKTLQKQLNELRSLNSTRYLYTANRDSEGRLIYQIDGLDLDADDFAYPGTYIEEEMIPYIAKALSGETVYSQDIMDTTWGHIFTACYPVLDSEENGRVIGALCIEMDMEDTYEFIARSQRTAVGTAAIAMLVLIVLGIMTYIVIRRNRAEDIRQQERLEKAVEAADAANKAKSTFLFNMSHDIRTPMNAIIGFSRLAENHLESPERLQDYISKIQVCGNKMLAIIDNVLELSRIESGKSQLEVEAIEAGSVFDTCVIMVQPELDKKNLKLTIRKDIECPYLYMDSTRVTEIVLNLISNAIKYTGEGGKIDCTITQKAHEKEGWIVQVLSIADNGIGMSEEYQEHIYESFSRERSSTASGVEGTGLGMGIVKKLIDMMDGTIDMNSKLGQGTEFILEIPCKKASFEETQPKRAEEVADRTKLEGKRILLAEDNDLNAEIAIELLSEVGLLVDRAENGVKCLEMLKNSQPGYYSLILMDVQMPVLDGYEATQKIRKFKDLGKACIPIIAMTANAFAEDKAKALEVGMNEHVAKPIDMSKLIPTLEKYL